MTRPIRRTWRSSTRSGCPGAALVKWWLLAILQYIIVALFTGGGLWLGWRAGSPAASWSGVGLIGILAVIAAVMLLVTGRYLAQIFDFGVPEPVGAAGAAYAGLMTDRYPPSGWIWAARSRSLTAMT